jgi:hypothetical protein
MHPDASNHDTDTDIIRRAIKEHGMTPTCRTLGVGREQVARMLAGLPLREGTRLLIRARIAERLSPRTAA